MSSCEARVRSYLLDTNVLIALIDPDQPFHVAASEWFYSDLQRQWLTCPITENGTVRIISLPRYPRSQPVHVVFESLRTLTRVGCHQRISDDVSLLGSDVDSHRMRGSGEVTDTYLALLAHAHGAQLATFDRRISTTALRVPAGVYQVPG
ncbi:MAG: TA system VapC family ribonuclease toxin [Leucobacter sp.]